jgi:hypothetical protein
MDTLHTVLRSLRGETKTDRKDLDVFREFIAHLEKLNRKTPSRSSSRSAAGSRRKTARRPAKT